MKALCLLGLMTLAGLISGPLAGCQHSLFNDADAREQARINTYYGGDSAVAERARRVRESDMGFGFPTGLANQ